MQVVRSERTLASKVHYVEVWIWEVFRYFRIRELCDQSRVCRITDINHMKVIHSLCLFDRSFREELESLALVCNNTEITTRQR